MPACQHVLLSWWSGTVVTMFRPLKSGIQECISPKINFRLYNLAYQRSAKLKMALTYHSLPGWNVCIEILKDCLFCTECSALYVWSSYGTEMLHKVMRLWSCVHSKIDLTICSRILPYNVTAQSLAERSVVWDSDYYEILKHNKDLPKLLYQYHSHQFNC